jgi:hypothetical protein
LTVPDFEVELDQLSNASDHLRAVSDKAGAAQRGVRNNGIDLPESSGMDRFNPIEGLFPAGPEAESVFGDQLGFDRIARAYEEHRHSIEGQLKQLRDSASGASAALADVVDVYRRADHL